MLLVVSTVGRAMLPTCSIYANIPESFLLDNCWTIPLKKKKKTSNNMDMFYL